MTGRTGPSAAEGYMAVLCTGAACRSAQTQDTDDVLRECVRASGHGLLVVAGCSSGPVGCRVRPPGQMILVQRCDSDRRPFGAAVQIGPIRTPEDLGAVRESLAAGTFDSTVLPSHLIAARQRARTAARN